LLGHNFSHQLLLLFLFGGGEALPFTLLLIEHFAQMALGLIVELVEVLAVVDFLGVDLFITHNHRLPDGLRRFLKIQVQTLLVLNVPKRVLCLDLLAEFASEDWLGLTLDLDFD
jgi:hypothetical protein